MKKNTSIMVGEDSFEEDENAIDSLCAESMGLFETVDAEGSKTYTVYWSDGDEMKFCHSPKNDKAFAEWLLEHIVFTYLLNKSNKKKIDEETDYYYDGLYDEIHSASDERFSQIVRYVESELSRRNLKALWTDCRNSYRVLNTIAQKYDRKDYKIGNDSKANTL